MIRKKIIRRVVRSDGIVQAERPEGKAFSADDWLVGVPVAGCLTGLGLNWDRVSENICFLLHT